jgi:hypothetical protein
VADQLLDTLDEGSHPGVQGTRLRTFFGQREHPAQH